MVEANLERLAQRLQELEQAMERHLAWLEELRKEAGQRTAYIDAKFARAQEVLRSIGRPSQESG